MLVEGSYIMLERLDKRVNVADNDMRMTIEESPLAAICAEVHSYDVPCLVQMKTATPGIVYLWENMGEEGETHKASLLSDADIQMYIEDTIDGAARLQAIGFDGIDLNAAGDNLPARFFSRFGNDRAADDPYGPATIENRTRIACEIIRGIKERCGADFVVQVLVNGAEENDGALGDNALVNTPEETVAICQALEAAGADALELRLGTFAFHEAQFVNDGVFAGYGYDGATSFGTFFDFDSHFSGLARRLPFRLRPHHGACRYVKQHVSIPVGGVVFMDPALAPDYFENALSEGWLDMIYMHRPVANCDAEYANKLREGRIDEIRPCCRCLNCLGRSVPRESLQQLGVHRCHARGLRGAPGRRRQERHGHRRRPCRHGGGARGRRARVRRHPVREERPGRPVGLRRNGEGQAREPGPSAQLPLPYAGSGRCERRHRPGGGRGLRA